MKKLFIILCLLLLSACKDSSPKDINEVLMNIKNYSCEMKIETFSNKNIILFNANETYKYPDIYTITFDDSTNINYSNNKLSIFNNLLKIQKEFDEYKNINQNPLFLSYYLNTYFNSPSENILKLDNSEVTIALPSNNPFLYTATLKLENNIPSSITYFDKNGTEKINIIYSKFDFESP